MGEGKYLSIWEKELDFILSAIEKKKGSKQLNEKEFQQSGDRQRYGFRLDIINGSVSKAGSAVARDLIEVLDRSTSFKRITNEKNILIQMGKDFQLNVEIIEE